VDVNGDVDVSKFEDMWNQEQAAGAERRAARPLSFYGRIDLAGRYVVLQKGYPGGKRDFDPTLDPEDARRMSVRVLIEPIDPSAARPFEREFLAYSAEGDLFRDALTGIGTTLKDLHDTKPYVRVDVVEDPRLGTFPDRTTGATRTRSTGLVREVFPSEDACRAAAEARYGGRERTVAGMPWSPPAAGNGPLPSGGAPATAPAAAAPANKQAGGIDRATAAKFFPGIWQRAGGDVEKFLAEMGTNKVMVTHFKPALEAPEVLDFLTKMDHPEYAAEAADKGDGVDLEEIPF
jgi:hypothetical protein